MFIDPRFFVQKWMSSRNIVEFLGVWEEIYNPNFNRADFDTFKNQAGSNSFSIPDFLLGVFRRYWSPNKNEIKEKSDRIQLHFEGLRDKYKIILDADKIIIYSRKRPISPLE